MKLRVVFEVIPRLVALLVLWESIDTLLRHGIQWIIGGGLVSSSITTLLTNALALAASITAVATVATASPLLYTVSLILLALAKSGIGILVSVPSIAGLAVMLFVDHIKGVYREGQSRSVRYPGRALVIALTSLAVLYTGITLLCVSIASYIQQLISALTGFSTAIASRSPILAIFLGNPLIQLAITLLMIKIFYSFLTQSFDIAALYAYPSKKVSLSVLTMREDIDARIEVPLQTLQSIIVASCLAPPVYAVLYDVLLPMLSVYIPSLSALQTLVAKVGIAIAVFALLTLAVRTISRGFLLGSVKRVLIVSLTLLALIYGAGAAISLHRTGDVVYALLNPDIAALREPIERIYINYYLQFFYIVDLLLKLVGAAP